MRPRFEVRRPSALPGLILVSAVYADHVSAPHAHEELALGACYGRLEEFRCGAFRGAVGPGSLLAIEPRQIHSDRSKSGSVRMVYAPAALAGELRFIRPVVDDAEARDALEALFNGEPTVEAWNSFLSFLTSRPWVRTGPAPSAKFGTLLERLVAERPPLRELAAEAGVSSAAFLRRFRREMGCTPHEYARQARITLAARRIQEGAATVDAALEQNFFDQSHFHRHFQRIYAVSPGVFRARNSVQS